MVYRAVNKVHDQITTSSLPSLPLILSEYNASYMTEPDVTDSIFMGPWLADTIRQCDSLVNITSYWTFSDVFEEQGVVKTPFYGGYGLMAAGGIPKPAFYAFELLHKLGEQRLRLGHWLHEERRRGVQRRCRLRRSRHKMWRAMKIVREHGG